MRRRMLTIFNNMAQKQTSKYKLINHLINNDTIVEKEVEPWPMTKKLNTKRLRSSTK